MADTNNKLSFFAVQRKRLSASWVRVAIYAAAALVFPEYLAPVFALVAFIEALLTAKREARPLLAGSMLRPGVVIFILLCIGVFYTNNILSTLSTIGLVLTALLFYIALTTHITTRRRLELTIYVIVTGLAVNGLVAGLQFLIGNTLGFDIPFAFWRPFDNAFLGLFGKSLSYYEESARMSSTFCNPNIFAQSMAMLLPFGMYFACSHRKDKRHLVSRILVPIAFIGTMFSFSRGVYLALIVILLGYSLYHIKKLRFILIVAVIIILLIPSSVYTRFISITNVQEFITNVVTDFNNQVHADYEGSLLNSIINVFQSALSRGAVESSSGLRFSAWFAAMALIIKKPFFGYGAGYINVRDVLFAAGITIFHTHNFILHVLMEGGLFLFAAVLWLEFIILKKGFMIMRQSSNPKLGFSILCFLFSFVLIGLTDIPTLSPKGMAPFAIALGLCESASSLYYERQPLTLKTVFGVKEREKAKKPKTPH